MDSLAANIRFYRKQQLMTQENLAEKTNLSVNEISKIERGLVDVKYSTLRNIATRLNLELWQLHIPHRGYNIQLGNDELKNLIVSEVDKLGTRELRFALEMLRTYSKYK